LQKLRTSPASCANSPGSVPNGMQTKPRTG
jgi:hypothetical protein